MTYYGTFTKSEWETGRTTIPDDIEEVDVYIWAEQGERTTGLAGRVPYWPEQTIGPVFACSPMDMTGKQTALEWKKDHRPNVSLYLWGHLGRGWMMLEKIK